MEQTQYLSFQLAGEEYAVSILRVKEIIEYGTLTKVPQTPPSIRGVINLRGRVVPVMDLALKLGIGPSPITPRSCIIILEVDLDSERVVMGVIADIVNQVIELLPDDILPAPAFGARIRVDFVRGMGKAGSKFVLILDIDKVLAGGGPQNVNGAIASYQDSPTSTEAGASSATEGTTPRFERFPRRMSVSTGSETAPASTKSASTAAEATHVHAPASEAIKS